MGVKAGDKLGPYEVVAPLGAGGMGEVWRARDTRLGRDVAVKVLPGDLAAEPERQRRFEREARAMAALAHPNLVAIFDVGVHEGAPFIVEEVLDGQSLRQRIKAGALPQRTAVDLAAQIARGLAAAHERGIVHRDLKPENVFVSGDGSVKVLDFGLARLVDPVAPEHADTKSHMPTGATEAGRVLGTVGYMAPEQVRGVPVDQRADIFSLGVVIYEMLSGANPFVRGTSVETFSAILNHEPPDLAASPLGTPAPLARLVGRLLEKEPGRRFHSAADVAFALEGLGSGAAFPGPPVPQPATRRRGAVPTVLLAAALVIAVAAAFALGTRFGRTPVAQRTVQRRILMAGVEPEDAERGDLVSQKFAAISPDGRIVAFIRASRLWLRELDSLSVRGLPGTEGARAPFWSPDSTEIAFWDGHRLRRIGVAGGAAAVIGEPEPAGPRRCLGGSWSPSGAIIVALVPGGVVRVPAHGGRFETLLAPDAATGDQDFHTPSFLPDGESFLFTRHPVSTMRTQLWVWHKGQRRQVLASDNEVQDNPVYSADGFVVYDRVAHGTSLLAVPFSAERCVAIGDPFVVLENATGATVSANGTLAAVTGGSSRGTEIVRLARDGRVLGTVGEPMDMMRFLALSPDGTRLAFAGVADGDWDIWTLDLERGTRVRVTDSEGLDDQPAWSPAGDTLAFRSNPVGSDSNIVARRADGTGPVRMLVDSRSAGALAAAPEWSPDGAHLLFRVKSGFAYVALDGNAQPAPVAAFQESALVGAGSTTLRHLGPARISPNGRFVAYTAEVFGRHEVFVRPFPSGPGQWAVSVEGGSSPRWSRRGDELFFLSGNTLMECSVDTTGAFRSTKPTALIDGDRAGVWLYSFQESIPAYDIAPDARSFFAMRRAGGIPNELLVVENWSAPYRR